MAAEGGAAARPGLRLPRLSAGAVAAFASAAVGLGAVAAAVLMSPWFSWTDDALSDLGHPRHPSAGLFGVGLLVSGVLFLVFVWALASLAPRKLLGRAAQLSLAGGGASLAAIGVVNESYGAPHFVVSFTYFAFVALGMGLFALSLERPLPAYALVTIALAVAGAAFGISILTAIKYGAPFPSQAIPEFISSVIFALWSSATGLLMLKGTAFLKAPVTR